MDIFQPFLVLAFLLIAAFALLYERSAPVPARATKRTAHARKSVKTGTRSKRRR